MIDIHTHILPGVDDGADDLDETVEMLRIAHESGTRVMVATPHMFHPSFPDRTPDEIRKRFETLKEDLTGIREKAGHDFLQDMKILLGAENFWGPDFVEALQRQKILPMNGSHYVLVEFHPLIPRSQLFKSAEILLSKGLHPILAHVERYAPVQKDPKLLQELLDRGCLTQLNARALEGHSWARTRRFALRLLGADLISLIASDAHGCGERSPRLTAALELLHPRFSDQQIRAWTVDSPRWVIGPGPS